MFKFPEKKKLFVPIVALLTVALLFVLISCHRAAITPKPEAINQTLQKPFTASANLKFDGFTAKADIGATTAGEFTFAVTEPKNLSGLKLTYNGDQLIADYNGLKLALNDDSLLAKGASSILLGIINTAAADSGVDVSLHDTKVIVKGKNDDGNFTIELDQTTGAVLSLSSPSVDLECSFDDFTYSS